LSYNYKLLATHWANKTIDDSKVEGYLSYCIHDFGYRGCSSDETAAIGGMSHLIHFPASDTLKGWECLKAYYPERANFNKPLSLSASEHSISCAYGLDNEEGYFLSLLTKFPVGGISLISDTYDIFDVCDRILPSMKELIEARTGPTVIRHDSGDQVKVLCGDDTKAGLQAKGTLQILADRFGFYINEKGYKVLNDKVRVIWGDGFNLDTYCNVFSMMESQGWSAENLVVGVGALLLNLHNRDDHGFAFKASQVTVNGAIRNIQKNPATDSTKKSKIGRIKVTREGDSVYWEDGFNTEPSANLLQTVFLNGKIIKEEMP
jgi:nicotinamide phosphoribosyltransferase